jgi:ribosomal silencing factor RsfS
MRNEIQKATAAGERVVASRSSEKIVKAILEDIGVEVTPELMDAGAEGILEALWVIAESESETKHIIRGAYLSIQNHINKS